MIVRRSKYAIWIAPVIAALAMLGALELTYRFNAAAAYVVAAVSLVGIAIRLLVIATKNLAERSRLINEAAHWHIKSLGISDAENPAPDGTVIPFSDDPQNPEEPGAS